ncbi:MAG: hypothetical protein COA41_11150 [Sphingopyxis sp.]|nr:MAG: hypothetical protein COA41_11150 [Sphingopyxis sp.]
MNAARKQSMPSGAGIGEFTKGDTDPSGDCGHFAAGIHHKHSDIETSNGEWWQRIVVYGDTPADAETLRDRVLHALNAAPPDPDVAALLSALEKARETISVALKTGAPDWFKSDKDVASHLTVKQIDSALAKFKQGGV